MKNTAKSARGPWNLAILGRDNTGVFVAFGSVPGLASRRHYRDEGSATAAVIKKTGHPATTIVIPPPAAPAR